MSDHVRQTEPFRWDGVPVLAYKPDGTHFAGITRQVLFEGGDGLACQLRYFEIEPDGYSSLERHQHAHVVVVIRGAGRALVGDQLVGLAAHDLLRVPPLTWHQFRAAADAPLGFLCLVDCERDRPERPDPAALEELYRRKEVAEFIRL
jgi:quercetin dioxygenase-like cupin family protein